MSNCTLLTKRFVLSPARFEDADDLHELWTSPGVRRYLFDDQVLPLERTIEIVRESERLQRDEGTGLWLVRERDPRLIGFAGFWYFREPPELELLFGVAENCRGRGVATETARAMLEHGFSKLKMSSISASTDRENAASIRVMERIGMRFARRETVDGRDTVFYTCSP